MILIRRGDALTIKLENDKRPWSDKSSDKADFSPDHHGREKENDGIQPDSFASRALLTGSETKDDTSPPRAATSLTSDAERKEKGVSGVRNTVSTSP
jgi:hypothetical protein